jgi:biopolymer transport protein ExbB
MVEIWNNLIDFLDRGGLVLRYIMILAVVLWMFVLERYWYHYVTFPKDLKKVLKRLKETKSVQMWTANKRTTMEVSLLSQRLRQFVPFLKTLIAICPLMGLLGTVTGMIQVFDIMGFTGTSNPRAMASGVSMATIPTMAGMVVALSTLYFSSSLTRSIAQKTRHAEDMIKEVLQTGLTHES